MSISSSGRNLGMKCGRPNCKIESDGGGLLWQLGAGWSWTVGQEEGAMEVMMMITYCHLFVFPFIYLVMNSLLNGCCGDCSYSPWYLQNPVCTDF